MLMLSIGKNHAWLETISPTERHVTLGVRPCKSDETPQLIADGRLARQSASSVQLPVMGGGAEDAARLERRVECGSLLLGRGAGSDRIAGDLAVIPQIENPGDSNAPLPLPATKPQPQCPCSCRERRPARPDPGCAAQMQVLTSERQQPLASNGIVRWDKNTNARAKQLLEVLAAMGDAPDQIIPSLELGPAIRLVVMIAVEHHLEPPRRDTALQVFHQRRVLVEGMNRPSPAVFLRNTFTWSRAMEWNDCKRNRAPLAQFAVRMLELLRRREKARVIVSDAELHARPTPRP